MVLTHAPRVRFPAAEYLLFKLVPEVFLQDLTPRTTEDREVAGSNPAEGNE